MFKKLIEKAIQVALGDSTPKEGSPNSPTSKSSNSKDKVIDEQVLRDIHLVIDKRAVIPGIRPRDENFTELEVVGESFYQGNLAFLADGKPGRDAGWFSGFLLPEPTNKYDKNAVAVYLIDFRSPEPKIALVGYLKREDAAKLGPVIQHHADDLGEIIPLLGRIFGGESESKPNYGVSARVFWDFK